MSNRLGFTTQEQTAIREAVRTGDFHKIKAIINSPSSAFTPTKVQYHVIHFCRKSMIPDDELFVKGYVLTYINHNNCEQERLLLITNTHLYHVKFDFKNFQISHFKRFPINCISHVYYGHFSDGTTKQQTRSNISYGVSIFLRENLLQQILPVDFNFAHQAIRVYMPPLCFQNDTAGKSICQEITYSIECSLLHECVQYGGGIVMEHEIVRDFGSIFSFFYNKFSAGHYSLGLLPNNIEDCTSDDDGDI
eukprot:TRINITY_DN2184_c0_g1_i1.p1 TRINITY_DN2184_c0_g1~~TRINITY_DN2184_c0_g1_i1.p1  ORF type:complete len:249 (+),score=50.02 TRINITY_DN2184_c0_g1_i1:147-893(+)